METPLQPEASSPRQTGWVGAYVLVVAVTAVVMLWQVDRLTLDSHEAYVAVTARTMLQPGHWLDDSGCKFPPPPNTPANHWLVPVYNGLPRLVKTPLAYWCVTALVSLGMSMGELASRLPAALAAILTAVTALWLGRRLFSARAALLGALMLATCLGVNVWGRNARPEMMLCLWCTLTMACFYRGIQAAAWRRHAWFMAGWVALGLANLSKEFVPLFLAFPILLYLIWRGSSARLGDEPTRRRFLVYLIVSAVGISVYPLFVLLPSMGWWQWVGLSSTIGRGITLAVLMGVPLAWYAWSARLPRQILPFLPTALPGLAVMALLFVPWLWYMTRLFPQAGGILETQVVERGLTRSSLMAILSSVFGAYYVLFLAKLAVPWVLFLPGGSAVALLRRFRPDRDSLVFLFCWVVGLVMLFSVAGGKREHYILPALPAMCLLMGYCAEDVFWNHRWLPFSLAKALVVGSAIFAALSLVAAAGAAIFCPAYRPESLHILAISALALVPLAAGAVVILRGRAGLGMTALLAGAAMGLIGYMSDEPLWDSDLHYRVFAEEARQAVPPGDSVAGVGTIEGQIIYYFGRDIPSMSLRRDALRARYAVDGEKRWQDCSRGPNAPQWLFAAQDDMNDPILAGYEPASVRSRGESAKHHEQVILMKRRPPTATTAPATGPLPAPATGPGR